MAAPIGEITHTFYNLKNFADFLNVNNANIQGGSDKSGIFFFFLLNGTKQLKIIRLY
jgi:hypothetical protein